MIAAVAPRTCSRSPMTGWPYGVVLPKSSGRISLFSRSYGWSSFRSVMPIDDRGSRAADMLALADDGVAVRRRLAEEQRQDFLVFQVVRLVLVPICNAH